MARSAAFVDLDRTLLPGASGPILARALRAAGVLPARSVPGEGLAFGLYDAFGETYPTMLVTRRSARACAGWDAEAVAAAGRAAAAELVAGVDPWARVLVAEHQAAGRPVVLATSSPDALVRPFAEALGLDDVVATRHVVADGRYTGELDGPFVWGRDKLRAVAAWAHAHGVALAASHAYSDSFFDLPLLRAVGHPTAVNPDARLAVFARLHGWPVRRFGAPPGVPRVAGVEPQRALLALARPELLPGIRLDVGGVEHLPRTGPLIVAANHRSEFDPVAIGLALARLGRPLRFLAKQELFATPVVGALLRSLGIIAVDRGSGSDTPLRQAARALDAGEVVVILPQGTIPRGEAFFDPVLQGRPGVVRLARRTGAPIHPLGLWGTEVVWPRSSRLPDLTRVLDPPTVRVRIGSPVALAGRSEADDARRVMAAVVELLPPEARRRRTPSAEELARTFPRGTTAATG